MRPLPSHRAACHDRGFTLIELLVVVIIIGILAAIAIPVFLNQRTKAWDAAARSEVRTVATALESRYADLHSYTSSDGAIVHYVHTQPNAGLTPFGYVNSPGVLMRACALTNVYVITTKHASSDNLFYLDSGLGQLRGPVAAIPEGLSCTPNDL